MIVWKVVRSKKKVKGHADGYYYEVKRVRGGWRAQQFRGSERSYGWHVTNPSPHNLLTTYGKFDSKEDAMAAMETVHLLLDKPKPPEWWQNYS